MIIVKLKTNLIDKDRIHRGKKHNYLDLVLIDNKNGRDEYGFDGFVKQGGLTKEEREARVEMPIIGNFTVYESRAQGSAPAPRPTPAPSGGMAEDDIPF